MKEGECMYLAKVIKSDNRMYVYDALNNKLATINSKEDLLENESYENFLRDNDFRDIKKPCEFEVKYPFTEEELKGMFNRKVKSITLALTEQCNLRCKYCGYMPKYLDHDYHLKEMPKDVAFKAIDFLMKNSQESDVCNIGFYGGEPLLRLNLIKECIAYVKERYPFRQPTYNITTNATLLDDKVAAFLVENDIKITISLMVQRRSKTNIELMEVEKPVTIKHIKIFSNFVEIILNTLRKVLITMWFCIMGLARNFSSLWIIYGS